MFEAINRAATAILFDAFSAGYPLDQAIRFHFQALGKGLSDSDREKVLFRVNTVCHHLRLLCAATGIQEPTDIRHWTEILHAARIMKAAHPQDKDLVLQRRIRKIAAVPAIGQGWSDEVYQAGVTDWGEKTFAEISAELLKPAPAFIRCNLIKTSPDLLKAVLEKNDFEVENTTEPLIFKIANPARLFKTPAFKEGLFEMQDLNSYRVAAFCGVRPGQRIADACAGAGGKSLALAAEMKAKGRIVAFDVSEKKLEELKRRARRAGAGIIEAKSPDKSRDRNQDSFDTVLVDAPCSGSGVIRRNPDTRWRTDVQEIKRLSQLQQDILMRSAKWVKPGGALVYASCSIFMAEGEKIKEAFLNHRQDFIVDAEQRLFPGADGGDGFYMVKFLRKEMLKQSHPAEAEA